jgi:hypothetical protein
MIKKSIKGVVQPLKVAIINNLQISHLSRFLLSHHRGVCVWSQDLARDEAPRCVPFRICDISFGVWQCDRAE